MLCQDVCIRVIAVDSTLDSTKTNSPQSKSPLRPLSQSLSTYLHTRFSTRYMITCLEERKIHPFIILRVLKIQCNSTERIVTHVQYLGWSDQDVPEDLDSFMAVYHVIEYLKQFWASKGESGPIVTHCSAGMLFNIVSDEFIQIFT